MEEKRNATEKEQSSMRGVTWREEKETEGKIGIESRGIESRE